MAQVELLLAPARARAGPRIGELASRLKPRTEHDQRAWSSSWSRRGLVGRGPAPADRRGRRRHPSRPAGLAKLDEWELAHHRRLKRPHWADLGTADQAAVARRPAPRLGPAWWSAWPSPADPRHVPATRTLPLVTELHRRQVFPRRKNLPTVQLGNNRPARAPSTQRSLPA